MKNNKILEGIIYNFIWEYFGESEAEEPCYNIELLAKYILNRVEEIKFDKNIEKGVN